jgi:hypothetical protein
MSSLRGLLSPRISALQPRSADGGVAESIYLGGVITARVR